MCKIVASFTSFTHNHKIAIYQDGDIIEEVKAVSEDMPDIIKGLKTKYNVDEIDLIGNPDYLKKMKEKLSTEFSQVKIEIITL